MEEVGKNLPKLLTNPLNFMEKELEDNAETHDAEALRRIREIVAQQQEVPLSPLRTASAKSRRNSVVATTPTVENPSTSRLSAAS